MKPVLLTALLLSLTIHFVGPLAVTAWFYAQQATLAAEHCENQGRPELHCDGQCYLAKTLQAQYAGQTAFSPEPEPLPSYLPLFWSAPEVWPAHGLLSDPIEVELVLCWPADREDRKFHPPPMA